MSTSRTHHVARFAGRLITAMTVVAFAVTAVSHEKARAATVTLNVTCSSSWTVYDVTAAQGDTVEVLIDAGCYNLSANNAYAYSPSASSPATYFSTTPTIGTLITPPNNKFTWVIKSDAPVGTMPGTGLSNLPLVCNNCGQGAVIRFTITAAGGGTTTTTTSTTSTSSTTSTTIAGGGGSGGSGSGGSGGSDVPEDLGTTGVNSLQLLALATGLLVTGVALSRRARPIPHG